MIYHYVIIILGFLSSFILFSDFPILRKARAAKSTGRISIIIPARNEEKNLQLLLEDLKRQTVPIHEIICVDDGSTDRTYEVASSFAVKVIAIHDKPHDWTGKAWACHKGAEAATGDIYLFLDADVRLTSDAVMTVVEAYEINDCVISVQPYHQTVRFYEQFSFFFNMIQIAGNGTSLGFKTKSIGLYGPVILFDRKSYTAIGGHLSAKKSVVDDVMLGEKLKEVGKPFKLYLGGPDISFRMYGHNFRSLFQGWVKNFAVGAVKTPKSVLILVSLWIASCVTSVIMLLLQLSAHSFSMISVLLVLIYCCWVIELSRIASKIGSFRLTTRLLFPVHLLFFIITFLVSLFKKNIQRHVIWKGRKIKLD